MKTPVCVVRLPRGPDPHGRGFDPTSPRYLALCPSSLTTGGEADPVALGAEQRARAMMRERFLRCLISMANRKIRFLMYEKVTVAAVFGAADIDVLNFQVSDLQTPIGVQTEALIRCQDVISYSFDV
ncbi:unnamed protein product [Boreogadus saida]